MNEEELIRQRKLAELKRRMEEEQVKKAKKIAMSQLLDKEAYARLSNIRVVKPELADEIETYLIYLAQQGRIRGKITDAQLKSLLDRAVKKKEFRIVRR